MQRVIVGLLGALATTTAFAADLPVKAPPLPFISTYNGTGFYVGGHIGGGWTDNTTTIVTGSNQFPTGTVLNSHSDSGYLGVSQIVDTL